MGFQSGVVGTPVLAGDSGISCAAPGHCFGISESCGVGGSARLLSSTHFNKFVSGQDSSLDLGRTCLMQKRKPL